MSTLPSLVKIHTEVSKIYFTTGGASAFVGRKEIPLLRAQGPVAVTVKNGEVSFGRPVNLPELREGQVAMVFDDQRNYKFWTLLPWVHKAQREVAQHKFDLARKSEQERYEQEKQRRAGIKKRRAMLSHGHDEEGTNSSPSVEEVEIRRIHVQASGFGLSLEQLLSPLDGLKIAA